MSFIRRISERYWRGPKSLFQVLLLMAMVAGVACSSLSATATPTAQAATTRIDQAVDEMLAGKATATATPRSRSGTATATARSRSGLATSTPKGTPRATPSGKAIKDPYVVKNVKIYDLDGRLAYRGDIDLKPTLKRIEQGIEDPHPNDGSVFGNRERRLPRQSDRNYYHEYVVRTKGIRGVGPQRLILGKQGEIYYTPDHYETFIKLK